MRSRKEAQIMKFTVLIVILFFFLFFFMVFQNNFFVKSKEIDMMNRCRQSTMISPYKNPQPFLQIIKEEVPVEKSGLELDCPIIYKTVNTLGDNDFYAKKVIADQMSGAIYKFNAGKPNLFSRVKGETINYCVVSSVIQFKGAAKNKLIKGFEKFIAKEEVPRLFGTTTYAEYMQPTATNDEILTYLEELKQENELTDIDTSSDYIVLFVYPKAGFTSTLEATILGVEIGLGTAWVIDKVITYLPAARPLKLLGGTKLLVIGSTAGGAIGSLFGEGKGYDTGGMVLLMPFNENILKELGCQLPVTLGIRPD
jgi:hypothetical protein